MTTEDEQRWAEAQSILDRRPTPSADERIRRWRRGRWALVAGVIVVGLAVTLLVAVLAAGSAPTDDEQDPTGGQLVLGIVVSSVGLLLMVTGLVVFFRDAFARGIWRAPAMVLSRGQRRELLAQVRSRRPVDPARLPLARDLARRLVDQTRFVVLYSGVVVSQIGQAILTPETWRVAMSAGLTFFFALVVALVARDVRRARRFLSQHPAPSADQDG